MRNVTGPAYLTPDALNYMGEWIAFSLDLQHIVGHGKTAYEADQMAKKSEYGFGVLFFMSESWNNPILV